MTAQDCVNSLLPHRTPSLETAEAFAPANIALCKYWGKRDEELKLPVTGSLSVSLGDLGTRMRISRSEQDELIINGELQPADSTAASRFFAYLNLFRKPGTSFAIDSVNTVPTGAGLASSASAFAAAVGCLNRLYGWELTDTELSILARLGSGSACRSLYRGFAEWIPGTQPDGMDSFAEPLETVWPEFRIGILTLSAAKKSVGSTEGMRRTMETATLYKSWPAQVANDLPAIRTAIQKKEIVPLGEAAEQNAMAMHATMMAAWPPVLYWQPETVEALRKVHNIRSQGVHVYATMDAGPNVKLIFLDSDQSAVQQTFPDLKVITPFS